MIKYIEAGERDLKFYLDSSFPRITGAGRVALNTHWIDAITKKPEMHNGQIYCGNTVADDGETLNIGVNVSDYKTYKWARDSRSSLPGSYTMGTCVFVFDPIRNAYTLLQRSQNLAFDEGKINGAGGVLGYRELTNMSEFQSMIQDQAQEEVDEELILSKPVLAMAFLGLYYNTQTLKVEFAYRAEAEVESTNDPENIRLLEVPKDQLAKFYHDNLERLESSTRIHLMHLQTALRS